MNRLLLALSLIVPLLASCSGTSASRTSVDGAPSWYVNPKQNDSENLYGVAEGFTLEEATKYALADAASRILVTVSSESSLLREENQVSVNEEMRQRVRQNVEKMSFTNFRVTNSDKFGQRFFAEVRIERLPFINQQKEQLAFKQKQVELLDENSLGKNPIQRRNSLVKILDTEKEIELTARILAGAKEEVNLGKILSQIANFQSQLDKTSDKIEFYFEINSPREISTIIRNALNKEEIKISSQRDRTNKNQIIIKINSNTKTNEIYSSYVSKVKIDFANISEGKTIASNSTEVFGSSSISKKESYAAALKSLEDKIAQDGILKILGIVN